MEIEKNGLEIQQLPKGYYAVQSELGNSEKEIFQYKGTLYSVIRGINLFASLEEANQNARKVPDVILEGLPYDSFSTPVLLFSAGRHCIDKFSFDRSLTLLGMGAGVNPNVFSKDTLEIPGLNPKRVNEESVLYGSYWHGKLSLKAPLVETVIVDGFSMEDVRFRDKRREGRKCYISFKNIIHISPCGNTLFLMLEPNEEGTLDRHVFMQNLRVVDFDDLDYGANFLQICAGRAELDGICFVSSRQIFGFTTIPRCHSNCQRNVDKSEYIIQNSYFRNLWGGNGISTGCQDASGKSVCLTVRNSVFINASMENQAVLNPYLHDKKSSVNVENCKFIDTRQNDGPAIMVAGQGRQINVQDCMFEGYAEPWATEKPIPAQAPDYIEQPAIGKLHDTEDPHWVLGIGEADFAKVDLYYAGRRAYYGDLHVHTDCGGTSDGKLPMVQWPAKMEEKKLDFAAVVDHRQMRGFFLPEWRNDRFIMGTEPSSRISGLRACRYNMSEIHFNMLFPHKYGLAMVLANFPEFGFQGDELMGNYHSPAFTKERFAQLTQYVQSIGGIMVHPHPKNMLSSDDPLDYYFGEHMYLETLYEGYMTHASFKNYDLWVQLLALGKHVYTSCGSDTHGDVSNDVVAVFYTKEKSGKAFFEQMRSGDFTAGAVGMKMCICHGENCYPMGAEISYEEGMVLYLRLDDFYEFAWQDNTAYELRIYTDRGLVFSALYNGLYPQSLALKVEKRDFYRAEVFDLTHGYRIAVGNPIWLDR